jgi:hypothetical protein
MQRLLYQLTKILIKKRAASNLCWSVFYKNVSGEVYTLMNDRLNAEGIAKEARRDYIRLMARARATSSASYAKKQHAYYNKNNA